MRSPAYPAFGLTLIVNHACNLRCSYCYTGAKFQAAMPVEIGDQAIHRALASVHTGGVLNLGFFGGEPLIEATRIREWMNTARLAARTQGKQVRFNLTTNGTIAHDDALTVLMEPDLELAISCDGTAVQHDKHRRDTQGHGTFSQVENRLKKLVADQRPFTVVMVVRPDTLDGLPAGLAHLRQLGVTRFTLSLDIWSKWSDTDLENLARVVDSVAELWRSWLPEVSIDWFDTRIASLANLDSSGPATRCSFGEGEITVAPSGRLYPCERLVGDDRKNHPLRLPGLVSDGTDFLDMNAPCAGQDSGCGTPGGCRCSNYVRTGSTTTEDGLLQALNKAVHHSLERLINATHPETQGISHE
jgi:uncharacterized protein